MSDLSLRVRERPSVRSQIADCRLSEIRNPQSAIRGVRSLLVLVGLLLQAGLAQDLSPVNLATMEWNWIEENCAADFRLRVECHAEGETAQGWIALNFQDAQHAYVVALSPQGGRFFKVSEAGVQPIGEVLAVEGGHIGTAPTEVTLKRRGWEMSLVVAGRVVARAYDDEYQGGRLGLAGPTVQFEEPLYQPVEPLFFTDDFMRVEGAEGEWRTLRGQWRSGSPREGTPADPRLSANPFFYRATPDGTGVALATAGHWFWDHYALQASVRLPAQGSAGLCGYVQDADHYLLFRVADPGPEARAQLLTVVGGQEQVLQEEPCAAVPGEWVALRFVVTDERLAGFVDGQEVCAAPNQWWAQGPAGLYVGGPTSIAARLAAADSAAGEVQFDDVKLETWREFRAASLPASSSEEGSLWTEVIEPVRAQVANAAQELPGEPATFRVAGGRDWSEYTVQAQVQPAGDSPVGLCVNYVDPSHFDLLRGRPGGRAERGVWELVQVTPAGARVLARSEGRFRPGAWHTLTVEVTGGCLRAQVTGVPALTAMAHTDLPPGAAPAGRVGLYTANRATQFREVVVSFPEFTGAEPSVTDQFTAEDTMAQWSTREAAWRKGESGWVWHRGRFPGDATLSFPLPRGPKGGTLRAVLGGDGHDPARGYQLLAALRPSETLQCVLQQDGQTLAKVDNVAWTAGDTLTFERHAGLLQVRLNDQAVLSCPAEGAAAGEAIGFRTSKIPFDRGTLDKPPYGALPKQKKRGFLDQLINAAGNILLSEVLAKNAPDVGRVFDQSGYQVDFAEIIKPSPPKEKKVNAAKDETLEVAELSVQSPQFYDCTFASAPVDWRVGEGVWQVTQRWTCSPQWTFFGGKDAPRPTLWSKTAYFGDTVLECFLAKPMHPETGKDAPVELNVTLCGDGISVDSGYSFTLAGEGGTVNRIVRQGKVVAQGRYKPTNANPHRAWYAVRVEKVRARLHFEVDGYDLLSYTDPAPLPGGLVAFWSDEQGILLARVRLSFDRASAGP